MANVMIRKMWTVPPFKRTLMMNKPRWLWLLAFPLLFSACATHEGDVLSIVERGNLARLHGTYGSAEALQSEIDVATKDSTGQERNRLLNDLILLIDLNYYHWEKLFYDKKAYTDFGSAVAATTLSSVSALVGGDEAKTILSAISSGITSTGVTFNSKVLQDQSLTAIFAKMRANRATQLAVLQAHMVELDENKKPIGATPVATYSVQQGLLDIVTYYNAGTFVAAIQDIVGKAASEKNASDAIVNNLKPNSSLANSAGSSGQKVAPPPVPKPTPTGSGSTTSTRTTSTSTTTSVPPVDTVAIDEGNKILLREFWKPNGVVNPENAKALQDWLDINAQGVDPGTFINSSRYINDHGKAISDRKIK